MVHSTSLRKIIMLAFIVTIGSLFVIRVIQRYGCSNEPFISFTQQETEAFMDIIYEKANQEAALGNQCALEAQANQSNTFGYDFSTMLKLIDLSRFVKNQLSRHSGFMPRKRKIDQVEIKTLLDELLRERAKLRNYFWELKGYSKIGIPPRQHRALTYYLEVIDSLISDMRELQTKRKWPFS